SIYEGILRIAIGEINFPTDSRHTEAVSVKSDAADHAFQNAFVLGFVKRAETQAVHRGDRPRSHREYVAKNSADACGGSLKGFDEGGVIVRLDLVSNGQTITDIDDAGILARALQNGRAFSRQASQVHTRAFVAAVLAPHDAENAELSEAWFAFEDTNDFLVFAFRQS